MSSFGSGVRVAVLRLSRFSGSHRVPDASCRDSKGSDGVLCGFMKGSGWSNLRKLS